LIRVHFDGAHAQLTDFRGAVIQRGMFFHSELQGALLNDVIGQGASFLNARLADASFRDAKLHGASFGSAQLANASFDDANMVAASLTNVRAFGASFERADLRAANFSRARLGGATFLGSDLQGALFSEAGLWGADLAGANVSLASFEKAQLWRVSGTPDKAERVRLDAVDWTKPPYQSSFDTWRDAVIAGASNAESRDLLRRRLSGLDSKATFKGLAWSPQRSPPTTDAARVQEREAYQRAFADFIGELACDAEHAPFVARRLALSGGFARAGPAAADILNRIVVADPNVCPGGSGLSDGERRILRARARQR
jgi:hypothetical protein